MPTLDPATIALLASVANIIVQMVKNLIPERGKDWIPVGLIALLMAAGAGLALLYGRDPVAGLLEGLFGGASAVGFYEAANKVPGLNRVWTSSGWLGKGSA